MNLPREGKPPRGVCEGLVAERKSERGRRCVETVFVSSSRVLYCLVLCLYVDNISVKESACVIEALLDWSSKEISASKACEHCCPIHPDRTPAEIRLPAHHL